jgi:hypothetical protein
MTLARRVAMLTLVVCCPHWRRARAAQIPESGPQPASASAELRVIRDADFLPGAMVHDIEALLTPLLP